LDFGGHRLGREKLFREAVSEIRRILFVRTDRIGDVLMNVPALRLLRQAYPKAWITLMAEESVADLLKSHPDLDEVMAVSARRIREDFLYRWGLAALLRRTRFDMAIVSNPDKYLHGMIFLASIPRRIGYDRKRAFFLTRRMQVDLALPEIHEIEKNLKLAGLVAEGTWDGKLSLFADEFSRRRVDEQIRRDFSEGSIVVMHPGTTNPAKRWEAARFAELGDRISADKDLSLLLIGGREEAALAGELARKIRKQPVNWTGELTLRQLIALFQHPRVKVLVSVDSGPVHVAWMSGTPVVVLYAREVIGSSPDRWGPRDSKSEVVYKSLASITAAEVYECVRKVLGK
jgi:heptosyltransferase-2